MEKKIIIKSEKIIKTSECGELCHDECPQMKCPHCGETSTTQHCFLEPEFIMPLFAHERKQGVMRSQSCIDFEENNG